MSTYAINPGRITLNPEQMAVLNAQMMAVQKDEVAGVLLALFLGWMGAHHFYLRRTGWGVLYLVFFWTGIPAIIGFIECFLMPGRVRRFNAEQELMLMAAMGFGPSLYQPNVVANTAPGLPAQAAGSCPVCGTSLIPGVRFCGSCGASIAS